MICTSTSKTLSLLRKDTAKPENFLDPAYPADNQSLPYDATMVHLGKVATDKDLKKDVVAGLEDLCFDDGPEGVGEDEFTSSVYGSRFAAADLPKHEIPEDEMPREIAYRMIKSVASVRPSHMRTRRGLTRA